MDSLKGQSRTLAYYLTAILSGIFIFVLVTSVYFDKTVFSSEFHKHLFSKNNIYSHMQDVLNSSVKGFVTDLKSTSPEVYEKQKNIFNALEKSFTIEMVKMNLDSISTGILQFVRGESKTLPDIYLNPQKKSLMQIDGNLSVPADSTSQALDKIDKINLGAILIYINRNDINDDLSICKLLYFIVKTIPGLLFLGLLLFTLIGIVLCKYFRSIINWVLIAFASAGFISVCSGAALVFYTNYIMPGQIIPLTMSLPLQSDIIISYLKDCTNAVSFFLILFGLSLVLLSILLRFLGKYIFNTIINKQPYHPLPNDKTQILVRRCVYIFLFALLVASVSYKFYTVKSEFKTNDFSTVIEKMKNSNMLTQVIAAQDDTFYSLNVKLHDGKTEKSVPNVQININGKSDLLKKSFDITSTTDNEGTARYALDKGTYRLSFIPSSFPSDYIQPSPFFFNIKAAGTTIITVNIDTIPKILNSTPGFAEIEILDKNNKPMPDLELSLNLGAPSPNLPQYNYSYTNSEGIAVFEFNEGTYTVSFLENKFPKQYVLPNPFEVNIKPDTTSRYTIRLSEAKPDQAQSSKTSGLIKSVKPK